MTDFIWEEQGAEQELPAPRLGLRKEGVRYYG